MLTSFDKGSMFRSVFFFPFFYLLLNTKKQLTKVHRMYTESVKWLTKIPTLSKNSIRFWAFIYVQFYLQKKVTKEKAL